jgi:hypothetical protein
MRNCGTGWTSRSVNVVLNFVEVGHLIQNLRWGSARPRTHTHTNHGDLVSLLKEESGLKMRCFFLSETNVVPIYRLLPRFPEIPRTYTERMFAACADAEIHFMQFSGLSRRLGRKV